VLSGFYAAYELLEEALRLRELTVCGKYEPWLPIEGIEPATDDYRATYRGLNVVVSFTES